jgi:Iap family predicted aminopeptidase
MHTQTLTLENYKIELSLVYDDVFVQVYNNESNVIAKANAYSMMYESTIEVLFKNTYALEKAINEMLEELY